MVVVGGVVGCTREPRERAATEESSIAYGSPKTDSLTFTRYTVDSNAIGPAYAAVADIDGDGKLDIVVSQLGERRGASVPKGQVTVYKREGTSLGAWKRSDIVGVSGGVKFPGQPTLADIDADGDLDMLLPSGFLVCAAIPLGAPCGGLGWYEHTSSGWQRHDVVPIGSADFYHHAVLTDVDHDGLADLVTAGERAGNRAAATMQWFRGTKTRDRFDTTPQTIGSGGGSFPRVIDVDEDGDLDVVSAQFFVGPSFVWFERLEDPSAMHSAGLWTRHTINSDMGASIMMTPVDDLFGDHIRRYIGANHTNPTSVATDPASAVVVFTPGIDPKETWEKTVISGDIKSRPNSGLAKNGAPGVFGVGDVDGDGLLDVVVSGDGDENVYLLRQTSPGVFAQSVLQAGLGQAGGAVIEDLDGDGRSEVLVTGYEDNVIYIFSRP